MNPEQLQAINERAEKATTGPWYSHADGTVFLKHTQAIADVWTDNEEADAAFIAHAREDIPNLIAEVERLRNMLKDSRRAYRFKNKEVKTLQHACRKHREQSRKALEGTK